MKRREFLIKSLSTAPLLGIVVHVCDDEECLICLSKRELNSSDE